jgi:SAM-dependent methyltransferase
VIDVGCGPGFAALDLAQRVGPTGRVVAVDRSPRFLEALGRAAQAQAQAQARAGGIAGPTAGRIETVTADLDVDELPGVGADAAWARWVFAFVLRPRDLLARVARAVRPGGAFVAHEYFDYATWRATPRVPELEDFVAHVMASWRKRGGEPDIALDLVAWLPELGFEIASLRPIVEVVTPASPQWTWVQKFAEVGLERLIDLGEVSPERGAQLAETWRTLAARPGVHMVTPAVLEIVAIRK